MSVPSTRARGLHPLWVAIACTVATSSFATAQTPLTTERVAIGFQSPLQVLSAPGDLDRQFVVEQGGLVKVVKAGSIQSQPFLDLSGSTTAFVEQGLLAMAFHPDYDSNGWVFVHYTNLNGHTRVDRFTVDANDPDRVAPSSQVNVLGVDQPAIFHNGGTLAFGPDGYLYLGLGDGGAGGAPAQDGQSLLGKMLRIDVDALPYRIPASNPFVGDPNVRDEIWALGLRNPWRFSFDRETGDLWIADVGEAEWEEIDFAPASSAGGENYGWQIMEGPDCHVPATGCNQSGLTPPFFSYQHGGQPYLCSITGGFVYRGEAMARMRGRYFYADYCGGQIFSVRRDAQGQAIDWVDHSAEFGQIGQIVGFGEDARGELYVVGLSGTVDRLEPAGLRLSMANAVGGSRVELRVTGGVPAERCVIGFSGAGLGSTAIGQLGLSVDLQRPQLGLMRPTDANGEMLIYPNIPLYAKGAQVWVQAVHDGKVSNVVTQLID